MTDTYQRSDSGLVLPVTGLDEAAVIRALKNIDPHLILLPPGVDMAGQPAPARRGYRVYRRVAGDRPPEFICFWGDDQFNPYPLSSALVDRVNELDRNTRGRQLDELARETLRKKALAGRDEAAIEGAVDTWVPKHGRPILHRSQALRRSRDKQRRRGDKV